MYWTEIGYQATIQAALMEGTKRSIVVQDKLKWPVGLALDAPAKRLYWCDSKLKRVESISLDLRDRHLIWQFVNSDLPTTIALHENFLYVTVESGKLYRLNKFGQGPLTVLAHGLKRPVGLAVYQQQQQYVPSGNVNIFLLQRTYAVNSVDYEQSLSSSKTVGKNAKQMSVLA